MKRNRKKLKNREKKNNKDVLMIFALNFHVNAKINVIYIAGKNFQKSGKTT